MLVLRRGSGEQAAVRTTRDAHQSNAKFLAEPAGGGDIRAPGIP